MFYCVTDTDICEFWTVIKTETFRSITSEPQRHAIDMYAFTTVAFTHLYAFDLWAWKPFQQFSLTC